MEAEADIMFRRFQSRSDPEFTTIVKENLVVEGQGHRLRW